MKYIRTKYGIYERQEKTKAIVKNMPLNVDYIKYQDGVMVAYEFVNEADTIEELCDRFIWHWDEVKSDFLEDKHKIFTIYEFVKDGISKHNGFGYRLNEDYEVYGAIWTDKGLIYVAKMNEKGVLELL